MITIYNFGEKIAYTKGDTFELEVNGDNFETGDTCLFVVAEYENAEPVISSTFEMIGESFKIALSEQERKRLELGSYIYKIVISSIRGEVLTQKSGDFIVKWGA